MSSFVTIYKYTGFRIWLLFLSLIYIFTFAFLMLLRIAYFFRIHLRNDSTNLGKSHYCHSSSSLNRSALILGNLSKVSLKSVPFNISRLVHCIKSLHTDNQFFIEFVVVVRVWIGGNRERSYALDIGSGHFTRFSKLALDFAFLYPSFVKGRPSTRAPILR